MDDRLKSLFENFLARPELDLRIHRAVADFLVAAGVNSTMTFAALTDMFRDSAMPEGPGDVMRYVDYVAEHVVAHSVRTMSPRSMAHMTTAIPYFMRPLGTLMLAMNQNMVRVDASRALTLVERQALAMMHRLVFRLPGAFYDQHVQAADSTLGITVSGGTLANITALWCARNAALGPRAGFAGIEEDGMHAALRTHGYEDAVVIGSKLAHYSFGKGMGLLGLGERSLISVEVDSHQRVDIPALRRAVQESRDQGKRIVALVGVAGTTDAGSIDPLNEIADVAAEAKVHFHVDAAWGGSLLFSERHRGKLAGIERADSVTIDGHKRLHLPTGIAIVLLRDPSLAKVIEKHTAYVIRAGSPDLGKRTLEGSRPGTALFLHAALSIFGRKGLEAFVDRGFELTTRLVEEIRRRPELELLAEAELNIVLYRYLPAARRGTTLTNEDNRTIDNFNRRLQRAQRGEGQALVGYTTVGSVGYATPVVALRAVLANPLTTEQDLIAVIEDQLRIAAHLETNPAGTEED